MEHISLSLPPLGASGEVVTFYSYKGGTGRTMALSNIAVLLARRHNATTPVLMIDWDLEAPGLHHYFPHHEEGPGVLELFEASVHAFRDEATLALLAVGGTIVYALAILILFGRRWLVSLVRS